MLQGTGMCPCWRAVPTPTAPKRVEFINPFVFRPDDDCSFCHGTGEASFIAFNRPANVRIGKFVGA